MDALALARSFRGSLGMLAMDWLMAPSTIAAGVERGMPDGLASYAVGRWGALGDCPVDTVVGAAFFWEPDLVRTLVAEGRSVIAPIEGARIWSDICAQWGEDHLADFDGAARLGELLDRVVTDADPFNAPLFVGWRDLVTAPPGPGRTFQLAQAMRELRFSRHCVAVQAAGITPLEAILAGPAAFSATMFGHPEPYPDVGHLGDVREEIEAHTDQLHARDLAFLSDDERAELRALAKAARAHGSN
ncbi:MAG: hypothetical protein R8F63_06765 [Acidimicrobiales bacterium]|nr:hypothetical protein [Acidimicrobiales bacterium]